MTRFRLIFKKGKGFHHQFKAGSVEKKETGLSGCPSDFFGGLRLQ
jgi:hypothetical protein